MKAPKEAWKRHEPLPKTYEEQEVQTVELGLVREVPDRTHHNCQWAQRCQRCLEPIKPGETIVHYREGWCHPACRFQPVARGP